MHAGNSKAVTGRQLYNLLTSLVEFDSVIKRPKLLFKLLEDSKRRKSGKTGELYVLDSGHNVPTHDQFFHQLIDFN